MSNPAKHVYNFSIDGWSDKWIRLPVGAEADVLKVVTGERPSSVSTVNVGYFVDAAKAIYTQDRSTFTGAGGSTSHEHWWGDLPSGTSTPGYVNQGGVALGSLYNHWEWDWWRVDLQGGQTYQFYLAGSGTNGGWLYDPWLWVFDPWGRQVTYDDDSGAGLDSSIRFYAPYSGTFFLGADNYRDRSTGHYQLYVSGFSDIDNSPKRFNVAYEDATGQRRYVVDGYTADSPGIITYTVLGGAKCQHQQQLGRREQCGAGGHCLQRRHRHASGQSSQLHCGCSPVLRPAYRRDCTHLYLRDLRRRPLQLGQQEHGHQRQPRHPALQLDQHGHRSVHQSDQVPHL